MTSGGAVDSRTNGAAIEKPAMESARTTRVRSGRVREADASVKVIGLRPATQGRFVASPITEP